MQERKTASKGQDAQPEAGPGLSDYADAALRVVRTVGAERFLRHCQDCPKMNSCWVGR